MRRDATQVSSEAIQGLKPNSHFRKFRTNPKSRGQGFMSPVSQEVAWFVSAVLVEAAVIDGWKLKVPNWLPFHMVIGGLAYATDVGGSAGLLWSCAGAVPGL